MALEYSTTRSCAYVCFLFTLIAITACGTLNVSLDEPIATIVPPSTGVSLMEEATTSPTAAINTLDVTEESFPDQAIAWYGTVHTIAGGYTVADYFKPWYLDIWPKYGPAVGISGADPTVNAEIERILDTDTKATFWGSLTCGASTYGPCQLVTTRLSANDGGPSYDPDQVVGWEGTVGRLSAQPGGQNDILYFVLTGEVPALYGVSSEDPAIQEELKQLADTGEVTQIWGDLRSKAQPVTGTLIDVTELK